MQQLTSQGNITRRINLYSIIIIGLILVTITSIAFTHYLVSNNDGMIKTINLAGRQRMLSQKIAKQCFMPRLDMHKKELLKDLEEWKSIHKSLQTGNDSLGIPVLKFEYIQTLFHNITPNIEAIYQGIQEYNQGKINQAALQEIIQNNEKVFLSSMDAIVFSLADKTKGQRTNINSFRLIYSLLIIVALVLSFFLVVKPLSRSLINYIHELNESESIIQAQNHELSEMLKYKQHQNEELQTTEEELRTAVESQSLLNDQLGTQLQITAKQTEQMENAQNLANLGYWFYDLTNGSMEWSTTMYTIFDVAKQETLTLQEYLECVHPDDVTLVSENFEMAQTVKQLQYTHRIIEKNGKVKTVSSLLKAQYNPDESKALAIFGVVQDITLQVKQTSELKKFNKSLKTVVAFFYEVGNNLNNSIQNILSYATQMLEMEVGIISSIKDEEYIVKYWHSNNTNIQLEQEQTFPFQNTYCHITYQSDQLLAIEYMKESLYSNHPCYQTFKLESYIGIPIKIHGKNSGTINFSSTQKRTTPFRGYEKDYIKILAKLLTYVFEKDDYISKLENFNQNQENILHVMAHDLRTPLSNLYGVMECLKSNELSDERRQYFFMLAEKEYKQGITLMEDLLDSFNLEHVDQNTKQLVNISNFSEDFIAEYQQNIKQKGITLNSNILPNIESKIYSVRLHRADGVYF
jgi:GAF domain-containing protein